MTTDPDVSMDRRSPPAMFKIPRSDSHQGLTVLHNYLENTDFFNDLFVKNLWMKCKPSCLTLPAFNLHKVLLSAPQQKIKKIEILVTTDED
jgi:hypothetical protein